MLHICESKETRSFVCDEDGFVICVFLLSFRKLRGWE